MSNRRWLNPRLVPTVPVEIVPGHPLAQGLASLYVPGQGLSDLCGRLPPVAPAAAHPGSIGIGSSGAGAYCATGGLVSAGLTGASLTSLLPLPLTFFSVFDTLGNSSGAYPIFGINVQGNGAPYVGGGMFMHGGGTTVPEWIWGTGTGSYSTIYTTAALPIGRNSAAISLTTSTASGYVNGASVLSQASGLSSGTVFNLGSTFEVEFGFQSGTGGASNTNICAGGVWARALSPAEIAWLAAEPFAMLRPKIRRAYYHSSLAAILASVNASTGSPILLAGADLPIIGGAAGNTASPVLLATGGPSVAAALAEAIAGPVLAAAADPTVGAAGALATAAPGLLFSGVSSVAGTLAATSAAPGLAFSGTASIAALAGLMTAAPVLVASLRIGTPAMPSPTLPTLPVSFGAYIGPLAAASPSPVVATTNPGIGLIASDPAPTIRTRDPSSAV